MKKTIKLLTIFGVLFVSSIVMVLSVGLTDENYLTVGGDGGTWGYKLEKRYNDTYNTILISLTVNGTLRDGLNASFDKLNFTETFNFTKDALYLDGTNYSTLFIMPQNHSWYQRYVNTRIDANHTKAKEHIDDNMTWVMNEGYFNNLLNITNFGFVLNASDAHFADINTTTLNVTGSGHIEGLTVGAGSINLSQGNISISLVTPASASAGCIPGTLTADDVSIYFCNSSAGWIKTPLDDTSW